MLNVRLPFGKHFLFADIVIEFVSFLAETIVRSDGVLTIFVFTTDIDLYSAHIKLKLYEVPNIRPNTLMKPERERLSWVIVISLTS